MLLDLPDRVFFLVTGILLHISMHRFIARSEDRDFVLPKMPCMVLQPGPSLSFACQHAGACEAEEYMQGSLQSSLLLQTPTPLLRRCCCASALLRLCAAEACQVSSRALGAGCLIKWPNS